MSAMLRSTADFVFCLAVCAATRAQPPETAALSQKQEIQRRVRTMARELVSGILDVQLRQLEENGLESLELYGDVRTMREHVDELIDAEMPEVVALLSRLEKEPAGEREQTFLLVRQKSREVLVRLLVERQALLRRLRMAEMVAQVKRLIELETGVLETTESLPERVPRERESLTLGTIEDQRDVKALYRGLEEMLRDAGTWGGPVGAEASTGLRRLETGRVGAEIDNARSHLEETRFDDAATSLEAVIRGLRTLLESIERAQGLVAGDAGQARDAIRQLADQQQRVRQATAQPDLNRAAMDELATEQSEIRKELAQLREEIEPSSAAQGALEQAENAAREATADLFEGRPEEATADQERVLEKLAEAARQVDESDRPPIANLTAEQHDRLVEDLEGAREDLQMIRKEQEAASEAARASAAEARKQEEHVADMLAKVPEGRRLPPEVTSRLSEAEEAATDAAARMDRPEEQRREATDRAEQAIKRAASEVEIALADARRQRAGVEIAELAQAARALDQAAAAEREIARETDRAADAEGLRTDEADQLGQRQADVADVAAKVAEGVRQSAPEAARILSEATAPLRQVGEKLQAASKQPGPASKPAARDARRSAEQAAEELARAADEIRREIGRSAEELAAALAASMAEPPSQEGLPSPTGGAVQQGGLVENQPPQPGPVQQADEPPEGVAGTPDSPDQAVGTDRRRFVEEPWLVELPPEVRAAIRANAGRRAPRGYEERLQRYFKNID